MLYIHEFTLYYYVSLHTICIIRYIENLKLIEDNSIRRKDTVNNRVVFKTSQIDPFGSVNTQLTQVHTDTIKDRTRGSIVFILLL